MIDNSHSALTKLIKLVISTVSVCFLKLIIANLKILSLGRNNIKKIEGLDAVSDTLEELWVSYNQIEKLNGVECCKKLKVLYASNNKIKAWDGIQCLVSLSDSN